MDTTLPQVLTQELKMLQQEKGKTCISIIIPFDNSHDQNTYKKHIEKAIEAVSDELQSTRSIEADGLIKSINELYGQITIQNSDSGLGLFVSAGISHFVWFPFLVKEKITVSTRFDLRDVLYKLQYFIPYYVLFFDKYEVRLFSGKQKQLQELKNKAFPLPYYDLNSCDVGLGNASFLHNTHSSRSRRDSAEKELFENFFSETDELISLYVEGVEALIVYGPRFYTSAFINRCHCAEKIISVINGSPDWFNSKNPIDIVWPVVEMFTLDRMTKEINRYEDKVREGLTEEGIVDVWRAVAEGRGATLLVEKDLQIQGFLPGKTKEQFYYHRPTHSYGVITPVTDAVDQLTEMALDKNTKVIFVDNGMLAKYNGIGLITTF